MPLILYVSLARCAVTTVHCEGVKEKESKEVVMKNTTLRFN